MSVKILTAIRRGEVWLGQDGQRLGEGALKGDLRFFVSMALAGVIALLVIGKLKNKVALIEKDDGST